MVHDSLLPDAFGRRSGDLQSGGRLPGDDVRCIKDYGYYISRVGVRGQVDFSSYNDRVVQMVVDLVNTHERYAGVDRLHTVEELADFLEAYESEWHDEHWCRPDALTAADLSGVRALRDRLRQVWDVADVTAATAIINQVLAETAARPRISLHGKPHIHFDPGRGQVADWLGAAAAMALATVLVRYGYDRLGICHSNSCEDVFIDTSRNRSRRNCSTTCTTRENVAAHRQRSRGGA